MNFKLFLRDIVYLSPILYLLLVGLPSFIQNPYTDIYYSFIIYERNIHGLTIILVCIQFLITYFYFRHVEFKHRIVLPFLFVGLSLHVYEELHHICMFTIGLPPIIAMLYHPTFIFVLLVFLFYYHKKLEGIVKINKLFVLSLFVYCLVMITLTLSGFFQQLLVEKNPFNELWALSKVVSFIPWVVWLKKCLKSQGVEEEK